MKNDSHEFIWQGYLSFNRKLVMMIHDKCVMRLRFRQSEGTKMCTFNLLFIY